MATCKQIRTECQRYFWKPNTFNAERLGNLQYHINSRGKDLYIFCNVKSIAFGVHMLYPYHNLAQNFACFKILGKLLREARLKTVTLAIKNDNPVEWYLLSTIWI